MAAPSRTSSTTGFTQTKLIQDSHKSPIHVLELRSDLCDFGENLSGNETRSDKKRNTSETSKEIGEPTA